MPNGDLGIITEVSNGEFYQVGLINQMRIFRKRNVHEANIRMIKETLDIFIKNGEAVTKLASPLIIAKVHYDDLQFYTDDIKVGIEIREVISTKHINDIEIGSIVHISLYNKNNLFQ